MKLPPPRRIGSIVVVLVGASLLWCVVRGTPQQDVKALDLAGFILNAVELSHDEKGVWPKSLEEVNLASDLYSMRVRKGEIWMTSDESGPVIHVLSGTGRVASVSHSGRSLSGKLDHFQKPYAVGGDRTND